ncbi:MAG: endonuclease/exonuclease/phosphatase family protein, partial [Candidatus Kariarchaeaceae archaeon]
GKILEGITANISLPEQLIIEELGEDISTNGHRISWDIEILHESEIISAPITVSSPWTYTELKIHSTYITASNWPQPTFSSPFLIKIEGGSIPIETARDLINTEVVIEGIATMYTGGFYAGSGAKFYISDETGGAQVYVAGAGGSLRVNIGDRVRVQGIVTVYRDSIEIVPVSEGYVEILETGSSETTPRQVSIKEAANDRTALPGELLQVEGTLARVEEFSYSYEIDIVDPDGQLLTIYIDKLTEINIDEIQSGNRFKVAGILELLDGNLRLYPRIQDDFYRIYPETLIVEAESEVSVSTLNDFDIILHIFNHTKQPVSQIEVTLPVPAGFVISGISDGGILRSNDEIYWSIDQIAGEGSFKTVSVTGQIEEGKDYITVENYAVTAPNFQEIFSGNPTYTFAVGTVPIWAIQGAGLRSPYTNRFLETQGIVTAVFPDLEGFWIQEKYSDNDPKTSPGIFIYTKGFQSDLSMGDFVTVRGIIQEYFQQTEIIVGSPSNIKLINSNNDLPLPIQLNPPAGKYDASKYYESLEGSLVGVTEEAIVIAPTNRYGEFAFVLSQHNRTRLFQGEENGIIIMADDGSSETHNNQSTLDYVVAVGDNINNITGPLAYSFGNYKIQPISPPEIVQNTTEYEIIAPPSTDEFSIMTWNVENLFDILDPHPSSPPLPKVSEYRQQISKVAETIIAGGIPMIVGLQEVENLGILEDITQHELLEPYSYTPILIEGTDSRGIDVGYLVRSDQAEILLEKQYPAPEGITSRPPLLVKVQVKGTDNPIYVLNNHFTSMSGGEVATEPRRNAQAEWNVTIMENILREDPNAYLAVIGDLNSYYNSLPIDTLRDAGLIHVFERIPAEERYTYIFQGVSQTLDHILVNRSLDALISEVVVLHTNSGYPISSADDFSPIHKSDHDPVIV